MKAHKALTIGLFSDDFFGGVIRSVDVLATELARQGHRVVIVGPRHPSSSAPEGCEFQPVQFYWHKIFPDYMGFLSWSNATVDQLCNTYKFDVVHSNNERGSMFLCAKIAKKMNIPHVHTFHSNYAGTHAGNPFIAALDSIFYMNAMSLLLGRLSNVKNPVATHAPRKSLVVEKSIFARSDWHIMAKLARHFDAYTSPAPFLVDIINDCTDSSLKNNGSFIANGISREYASAKRTRSLAKPIRFMSCGRLDPEKRIDVALRAFDALNDPNAELYIIGDGSQMRPLQTLARQLNIGDRVTFLGRLGDRTHIANHYANADIFLFPSYHYDTQGLVLGEAASAGEAIIYCDDRLKVGVSAQNSMLVKPTANAFKKAMLALLSDPAKLHDMRQASLSLRPSLSPETMAQKMLGVYTKHIK